MVVRISRTLLNAIIADAAIASNVERCGLLLGREHLEGDEHIEEVRFAPNVAANPRDHFELDPSVLIAVHKAARAGGARILGHYHSHPYGRAVPSATDAQCAAADQSLWLLVAGSEATLWRAVPAGPLHRRFQAEPMEIYGDVELA